MRISTRGRYGVRALLDLALHGAPGRPIPLRAISRRQKISEAYLEQLFSRLRRAGFIESVQGRRGGFLLRQPVDRITIWEVLEALGEPQNVGACQADEPAKHTCAHVSECVTRTLWSTLGGRIQEFLKSATLSDLLEDSQARLRERRAEYPFMATDI